MEYGYFAPIVSRIISLSILLTPGVSAYAQGQGTTQPPVGGVQLPAGAAGAQQADVEAALLHRRLDLSSVQQWDRTLWRWLPLALPPARIYVINLWSVYCEPCQKEFPQLRGLMKGWRAHPEVQFVFLADPPDSVSESEVVAFWRKNQSLLPDTGPSRTTTPLLRQSLDNDSNPITLLVDKNMVVRQAFVGSIGSRAIGRSLERLMQTLDYSFVYSKKTRLSASHR